MALPPEWTTDELAPVELFDREGRKFRILGFVPPRWQREVFPGFPPMRLFVVQELEP